MESFEIHQSMWKVEPNSQQTTDNNSGQSDPYVSFLLRQTGNKQRKTAKNLYLFNCASSYRIYKALNVSLCSIIIGCEIFSCAYLLQQTTLE